MRDTFVRTLIDIAKADPNVELITGDLGFGVLKPYWEQLPDQFINAGIAEQNMTSVAAGMALEGKTVFTYSIGNFPTLRCLEQIRNDCAYPKANVKIVCVGGGFVYGSLGMIHDRIENFEIGKAIKIRDGEKVAVFSTGAIFDEIGSAVEILEGSGINPAVYTFPTVKPIDREVIEHCAENYDLIVTVEEHNIVGGFGSAVAEVISELRSHGRLIRIGLNDTYSSLVGNQKYLRSQFGLDAKGIADRILAEVGK